MNSEARQILEAVKAGSMSIDDALLEIKKEPFEDIGYAKVDLHRKIRQGAAEGRTGKDRSSRPLLHRGDPRNGEAGFQGTGFDVHPEPGE